MADEYFICHKADVFFSAMKDIPFVDVSCFVRNKLLPVEVEYFCIL